MPSPFPGMNPYLEQNYVWEGFHNHYLLHMQEILVPLLPNHYFVRNEPRLFIHELSEEERRFFGKGELGILEEQTRLPQSASTTGIMAAPLQLHLPTVEEERISVLKIHDLRDRHVVTVVELLSPSNKTPSQDYETYNAKRRTLLRSGTHFVEIDLRRGGKRPEPPVLPSCDYYALVSRFGQNPRPVDFWPIPLRERLPVIPIPLVAPDPDLPLDLQEVLHRTYDAAGYGRYIYQETPEPPLRPEDAAWAQQFLPSPR